MNTLRQVNELNVGWLNYLFVLLRWKTDFFFFQSKNVKSQPPEKIHRITNTFPAHPEAPFYNPGLQMKPVARLYLKRLYPRTDEEKCEEEEGGQPDDDDTSPTDEELIAMMKKKMMMQKKIREFLLWWRKRT